MDGHYLYGEDQDCKTSFKDKGLQAAVDSWCKIQVLHKEIKVKTLNTKSLANQNSEELPFHPCLHPEANRTLARIHLPVAKNCNLTCRYCARQHNNNKTGLPGTSNVTMNPEQALNHLCGQRKIWGDDAVVGISGPGEPLANPETFETLKLIKANYPSHPLCLCTNGFLLKDSVQELHSLGIKVISITINGIDPEVVQNLQPCVKLKPIVLLGKTAAADLIEAQITGLKMAVSAGMFVKANTVLVEGVNDGHIIELSRFLSKAGAGIMNIMPVVKSHARSKLAPPNRQKIEMLRTECEKYLPQFRLCRQCRSDSAGIPGQIKKRGCCS